MTRDTHNLIAALEPLTSRARTDVTAIKAQTGMSWTREPLTEGRLKRHLDGTMPRGVCPIKAGESTTRIALFDLDSHKGQTSWEDMVSVLARLEGALQRHGLNPVPWRSSGGRGVHTFLVWDEPQDAYSVRQLCKSVLEDIGYKDGAKGVAQGEIEVFPKQDSVPGHGFGNQFILPLAGKSAPLEPLCDYEVMDRDYALQLDWRPSAPVPVVQKPEKAAGAQTPALVGAALKPLATALAAIPNDTDPLGYDEWRDVISGIHHATQGSDEGYALAYDFSARAPHFDEQELDFKVWAWLDQKGETANPITERTIFAKAREHGWQDIASADDFEDLTPAVGTELSEPQRVLDAKDSMGLARAFERSRSKSKGCRSILRVSDLWYEPVGSCWSELPNEEMRHAMWSFLDRSRKIRKDGGTEEFKPNLAQITGALDALRSVTAVRAVPPCWLPGENGPAPCEIVSLADGLLHIPTRRLLPHTAGFFTLNTLPYGWAAGEEQPMGWLQFLEDVWPGDAEAQEALQEMFGYLLTADTSQQKMFLVRGPKRSGKGTIARVLAALVGRENTVSPTLTSLTSNFGLQPLIGRLVAIIPDARVGAQTNTQAVVEKLLMLSGEDSVTVDRKHREAWTGTLSTRIVIMTNEVPQLGDASGALAGRFITISMQQSFFGKEDPGLTGRLLKELPGIFRWALEGRDRLSARGYFVQPASAEEDAEELAEANSPVSVFVDEVMERGPELTVSIDEAFEAWKHWCVQNGRTYAGTKQTLSKALRAAFPHVHVWRPRRGEDRVREFTGICVKSHVRAGLGLFGSL